MNYTMIITTVDVRPEAPAISTVSATFAATEATSANGTEQTLAINIPNTPSRMSGSDTAAPSSSNNGKQASGSGMILGLGLGSRVGWTLAAMLAVAILFTVAG